VEGRPAAAHPRRGPADLRGRGVPAAGLPRWPDHGARGHCAAGEPAMCPAVVGVAPGSRSHEHARAPARALRECPPPALASVRRELHIDLRQLAHLYPDECGRISERHLRWIEVSALAGQAHRRRRLVLAAMAGLHAEGRYPSRHQIQLMLPSWVSLLSPILRALWKDEGSSGSATRVRTSHGGALRASDPHVRAVTSQITALGCREQRPKLRVGVRPESSPVGSIPQWEDGVRQGGLPVARRDTGKRRKYWTSGLTFVPSGVLQGGTSEGTTE